VLLRKAGLESPYLLLGHSRGGLNLRLYASLHPDEVAGLILVDALNMDFYPARTTNGTWVGSPHWLETQYALTNISSRSSLLVADTTEHDIQFHRPDQIVAAVREMMITLRGSQK
jgi:triacylglycerol esterase/lipase EstA (alpha/beta hydrolase family)